MNKNKVEFIKDTFDEYLSKDSVSASDLKNFLKSPRSYFYEKNRTEPRPEKRHFSVGSALHQYIMERENFDDNFIVSPKFDRRKKQGKLDYEEFVLKAEGKTIINDEEMDMIKQMSVNAKMNKTFMEFLEGSQYEVSCYTKDDNTGLDLRLRRYQYRMALDLLKWSRENNYWCDYIEFEILKEKYLLGELSDVIDTIEKSELINILK